MSLRSHSRLGARRSRGARGMTLIETLIVMAIAALLIGAALTGIGATRQAEVARATNQLANTIRFAYNKARVTGAHYRLLIDLDKGQFSLQRGDSSMYLPATDRYGRQLVIDPSRAKEKEERDKRAEENYNRSLQARVLDAVKGAPVGMGPGGAPVGAKPGQPPKTGTPGQPAKAGATPGQPAAPSSSTSSSSPDKYITPPKKVPRQKPPLWGAFEDDNSLSELKKPFKFPAEVKVVSVRTADDLKPITKGEANLYFFPQGHTQLTHIHVQAVENPDDKYTIVVKPLTGRVEIQEGFIDMTLPDDPTTVRDDLGKRQNRRQF